MLAYPTTPRLPPSSTVLLALLLAYLPLSSIRRPYITFKLPRSNIDTPQRLRNLFRFSATGMCHFLPVHHLEWHFWPGSKGQNITRTERQLKDNRKNRVNQSTMKKGGILLLEVEDTDTGGETQRNQSVSQRRDTRVRKTLEKVSQQRD